MLDLDVVRDAERREDIDALIDVHIPALIAEVERLRVEATTTMVCCEKCGHGVRPRYAVLGMCPDCAADRLEILQTTIARQQVEAAERLQELLATETEVERLRAELLRTQSERDRLQGEVDYWREAPLSPGMD